MPRFAANLTMMFNEVDFLDRFEAAARAGFKGVEYLFPYAHDKDRVAELLRRHGLTQVLFDLPCGDWGAGERGIACLPDRAGEFRDGVGMALDFAGALDCKRLTCLAGIAPTGVAEAKLRDTLIGNMTFAAAKLKEAGITLLLEPLNRRDIPGSYVCRSAQAMEIIGAVGADNVALQYDVYHMQIMEGDLAPTIERHLGRVGHFQIADTPGRHEPGTGEINYEFLFRLIDDLGYRGWIGCEYKPKTTTVAGLGWIRPHMAAARTT